METSLHFGLNKAVSLAHRTDTVSERTICGFFVYSLQPAEASKRLQSAAELCNA